MKYLLDTNVISELVRDEPATGVVAFFERVAEENLYLCVITIGELHHGIEKLDDGKRKRRLHAWIGNELMQRFRGRILAFGAEEAETWGRQRGALAREGRTPPLLDSMIAAIAIANHCVLVTSNDRDFEPFDNLELLNPFLSEETA